MKTQIHLDVRSEEPEDRDEQVMGAHEVGRVTDAPEVS